MKTLVIVSQPFFSFRGTSFSVYYRTLMMAEKGVKIDLLTYGEGEDIDIPGVNIIRIPKFSFLGSVKVGPSFLKAFLNIFVFFWTVGLLIKNKYDCVHAHEESAFFCVYLRKIFRFKLIYDMHSSLPQQLTNFKFTNSKLLIGLFKKLEIESLKKADAIITICPELERYALSLIPNRECHYMIENSIVDTIKFKSHRNPQYTVSIPKGRDVIVYAGTFEKYQGIDLLISSFQLVNQEKQNTFLLMIGGSQEQVNIYKEMLTEHCILYPRIPQSQVRAVLSRAALQISPRIEGTNTPLKIYEQLANGIPLVATRIPSHTQILTEDVCFLVDPNPQSLAEGMLTALNDPKKCEKKVKNAKTLYDMKYSRAVYKKKIDALLHSLR